MYRYIIDMLSAEAAQPRLYKIGKITLDRGAVIIIASDRTITHLRKGDEFDGIGRVYKLFPIKASQITGELDPVEGTENEGDIIMYGNSEGTFSLAAGPCVLIGSAQLNWLPGVLGVPIDTRPVNLYRGYKHNEEASINANFLCIENVTAGIGVIPTNIFGINDPVVGGTLPAQLGIDGIELQGSTSNITARNNINFALLIYPALTSGLPAAFAKYIYGRAVNEFKLSLRLIGWQAGRMSVYARCNSGVATPWCWQYKVEASTRTYRTSQYLVQ